MSPERRTITSVGRAPTVGCSELERIAAPDLLTEGQFVAAVIGAASDRKTGACSNAACTVQPDESPHRVGASDARPVSVPAGDLRAGHNGTDAVSLAGDVECRGDGGCYAPAPTGLTGATSVSIGFERDCTLLERGATSVPPRVVRWGDSAPVSQASSQVAQESTCPAVQLASSHSSRCSAPRAHAIRQPDCRCRSRRRRHRSR